ncbi:TPA: hypothetical protein ACV4I4_005595, partial [Salmonella enterica]
KRIRQTAPVLALYKKAVWHRVPKIASVCQINVKKGSNRKIKILKTKDIFCFRHFAGSKRRQSTAHQNNIRQ